MFTCPVPASLWNFERHTPEASCAKILLSRDHHDDIEGPLPPHPVPFTRHIRHCRFIVWKVFSLLSLVWETWFLRHDGAVVSGRGETPEGFLTACLPPWRVVVVVVRATVDELAEDVYGVPGKG